MMCGSSTHEIPRRWCRWKMLIPGMHWQSLCWWSLFCQSQCYHLQFCYSQFCHSHQWGQSLWSEERRRRKRKGGKAANEDVGDLDGRGHQVDKMLWGMSREVSKTDSCLYYDHLFATGRIHKSAIGCTSAWSAGTISTALLHAYMAPQICECFSRKH